MMRLYFVTLFPSIFMFILNIFHIMVAAALIYLVIKIFRCLFNTLDKHLASDVVINNIIKIACVMPVATLLLTAILLGTANGNTRGAIIGLSLIFYLVLITSFLMAFFAGMFLVTSKYLVPKKMFEKIEAKND